MVWSSRGPHLVSLSSGLVDQILAGNLNGLTDLWRSRTCRYRHSLVVGAYLIYYASWEDAVLDARIRHAK